MTKIEKKFQELSLQKKKALITYITAGDPDIQTTEKLVTALEKGGADLIELGIPFSDPTADGPTIQKASERALLKKTNLKQVLGLVEKIRSKTEIPIILMGYYNPIFQFGEKDFCEKAKKAGVDGLIIVDLPLEESFSLQELAKKNGLNLIYLLTPTSDEKRIQKIKKFASGFIYYVSTTGVTGGHVSLLGEAEKGIKKIKKIIDLPICLGFGIRTTEDVKKVTLFADGVVVGSAIVEKIEKKGKQSLQTVAEFVKELKHAFPA